MNPDEPHSGGSVDDQPLSYRMLYIDEDVFRDVLPERARLPYFRDLRIHNDHWAGQALFLHRILSTHAEAIEQQSHLYEILPNFIRAFSDSRFDETDGREPSAIGQIKEFLRANYQRNVSVDELAQLTRLNRAYLIRAFRRSVGIPPYHSIASLIRSRLLGSARRNPLPQATYIFLSYIFLFRFCQQENVGQENMDG